MTYLEQLLEGKEVAWRPLGEVCLKTENVRWTALSPETEFQYIDLASVSVLHRQIEDTQVITSETAPSRAQQIVRTDDVLFGATRPTLNRLCVVPPQYDGQICSTGFCILRANRTVLLPRFLFHCLQEPLFQRHVVLNQQGTIYPMISNKRVREFLIPLPPIAVQQQIVEILDKFTELIEALETELTLRTRQYAYYRNKLLRFGEEVEWRPLGEVFEIRTGYTPSKANKEEYWNNGTIPWFRMEDLRAQGGVLTDSIQHITPQAVKGKRLFKAGSIILSTTATIGEHALLLVDALTNQRFTNFNLRTEFADRVLSKFLYYYFFEIAAWCKNHVFIGTFPSVDMRNLRLQKFPLPPLAVQEQIVAVLDKFHTLVHSLSEGLPAEIALRRRQYEYYRNLLLRFPPPQP